MTDKPQMLDFCKCGHPFEEHDWGAYSEGEASCLVEECDCQNFSLVSERDKLLQELFTLIRQASLSLLDENAQLKEKLQHYEQKDRESLLIVKGTEHTEEFDKRLDRPVREKKISNLLLANLPRDVGSIGSILAIPDRVAWCDEMAKRIVERDCRKPLDGPELREIHAITDCLATKVVGAAGRKGWDAVSQYVKDADSKLLALIPDIEEIRMYYKEIIGSQTLLIDELETKIEEAKKQERERIMGKIETTFSDTITKGEMTATNAWRALQSQLEEG